MDDECGVVDAPCAQLHQEGVDLLSRLGGELRAERGGGERLDELSSGDEARTSDLVDGPDDLECSLLGGDAVRTPSIGRIALALSAKGGISRCRVEDAGPADLAGFTARGDACS